MLALAVGGLLLLAVAASGCGQKGPLTLPPRNAAAAPSAPAAAASAPAAAASAPTTAASAVQAR